MATRAGVEGQPIPEAIARYVVQSIGVSSKKNFPDVWLGPGVPLADAVPPGAERRFEYQTGYNITQRTSRDLGQITFQQLRSLANMHDITRLAIETRKDQMAKLPFSFRPKRKRGEKRADTAKRMDDPRIDELETFFKAPGSAVYYPPTGKPEVVQTKWDGWLRALLEDVLVIDAPAVSVRRSIAGTPFSLDVIDGATVKPLIDSYGSVTSYQQWIYGMPGPVLGPSDLVYMPRNPRSSRIYGFSPVEQIATTVNIALRRTAMQLAFYTDGNIPEGFVRAPESWSADQIEKFQKNFDLYMTGNARSRAKLTWVPGGGADPMFPKKDSLKTEEDEWWTRIICYAFSLSPQAFIKQMNRATAENAQEEALEQGLMPLMLFVQAFINELVRVVWGPQYSEDIEGAFEFAQDIDPVDRATVHKEYVSAGILSINEAREDLGKDPIEGGDTHGFITAAGFVPLEQALKPPEPVPAALAPGQKQLTAGNPDPEDEKDLAEKFIRGRRAAMKLAKARQYARASDQS